MAQTAVQQARRVPARVRERGAVGVPASGGHAEGALPVAAAVGGAIDLPVTGDFTPAWPQPVGVITDGATLRVLRLPPPTLPADLPSPPAGRRYLGVDVLVENLRPTQALEFQIDRQLRVLDASGVGYAASPESSRLPFRATGVAAIPAAAARRFQMLYVVPATEPLRLEYRGFERSETVEIGPAAQR